MIAIYKATRDGDEIIGGAARLAQAIRFSTSYIRHLAVNGRRTSDGWKIDLYRPRDYVNVGRHRLIFTAEKPGEEPRTGTAIELQDFLGIVSEYVNVLARKGRTTRSGWTVRLATPEEAEAAKGGRI